ncbi:hypothetical protein [Flavobacterium aciduliphilum]|uniref:Uncharacterized protein n=1 Tax=Flavobacterium aciduliphilum TaxID=1101402 RepID=A0A328YK72_9FLAO|nr:hypothetical protein [Flavobacterium aciduliphilum]RAR73704.1 hypothetical protein CLV55_10323 [Flavobacterium aciduliphilum]
MTKFNIIEVPIKYIDFYINVDCTLFCPEITNDWKNIKDDKNRVNVFVSMYFGELGIEGSFALGLPPIKEDIEDAWEFSRKAGTWDWYSAYKFIIKINDIKDYSFDLQLFNIPFSLFELDPYKIKKTLNLNNYKNLDCNLLLSDSEEHNETVDQLFKNTLDDFMKILKYEFDANLIDKPLDII